jgi:hypothetical protein
MDNQTTFASLSPSLLARKGAARPAMRSQVQPLQQYHENVAREMANEDDLGWNDHGEEVAANDEAGSHAAEVVPIHGPGGDRAPAVSAPVPEVVLQQNNLPERLSDPAPARQAPERRSALAEGRRAAFTLRLDAERHLSLRLACTITNRSAQQILTEALDHLIGEMPEIAPLARQLRGRKVQQGDRS